MTFLRGFPFQNPLLFALLRFSMHSVPETFRESCNPAAVDENTTLFSKAQHSILWPGSLVFCGGIDGGKIRKSCSEVMRSTHPW